jgi:trk system potassium uptake protein TrkA
VVVVGLGRFGTALALELTRRGTEVLGIDNRPTVVQEVAGQLAHVVTADSTDIEALRQLGMAEYYRAVVAIGSDMEASILTTSLLGELGLWPTCWPAAYSTTSRSTRISRWRRQSHRESSSAFPCGRPGCVPDLA